MDNKRIVVALGRNAFGETFPEQQQNVKKAAVAFFLRHESANNLRWLAESNIERINSYLCNNG